EEGKDRRQEVTEGGKNTRQGIAEAGKNNRAGGGRGAKLTKDQQDKMVAAEAGKYGVYRVQGQWKQWEGTGDPGKGKGYWKDATPEWMSKVTESQGRIARESSPNAPGAGAAPYPDGTKLRGPDGKMYEVRGGKPVIVE